MKFEQIGEGKFKVSGRGELQITILAEIWSESADLKTHSGFCFAV
jgi:predicted membrane GTPase involved in stress response